MASNTTPVGDTATFTIKVNGNAIDDESKVLSIYVEKRVNRIAYAKIVILDGDADDETFKISSSATFVPGAEIVIEAGYDSKNTNIFKGIITGQTIRIDALVGSALEVECRDEAIKMIVGRKSLTYSKQKDSDVISTIIGNYSGLSSDVSSTPTTWPEQVQYYVTDWDYIMTLAENNGMVVTAYDNKVSVFKPDANTSSVLTVKYGDGLMEFNADLQSIYQIDNAKADSWDYKTQAVINGEATNSYAGAGNLSTKKLSEVVGLSEYRLQTIGSLESADLTNWSKAQLVKSEFSKIQGEAKFQGTSIPNPGQYITLGGLGDRFNGDHIMSGIVHDISEGNWITRVNIGLPFGWFTEEPDVVAPPASGVLPGVRGLSIGTVKKMYEDPDSQYRILVDVPLFDSNGEGIWARLSNFYSTNGAGAFFMPEVGDEVVLGFLNEDPRYPIILGSMYSSTNTKPYEGLDPNEKNSIKAIVSKSGISIEFDDENKILTVNTPNKNTVILSDQDKQITLKDENDNSIVLSSSGITIKSPKSINIEATESVNIKGTQGVKVQASGGDVAISGMNIKQSADVEYSAEGSATAKVSGGAQLTLKGAMVMIN
ncbi:type VI secretion system tip protein VgrG [Flavobacterium arcticum]|uniref:Type VI secretion system tip protein VgrG n=1 Tax=Flavobacterium arcticum TaxID=1784713 RepID=A0A345HCS0_9FLAO|nr:type VI secretion system tip protein VgrG [Flavobacterium arcticum]AXG74380.1 type VI secretion system tip protein VgrG [Flavobacterium arcticum]KAF2507505.1 type VI secretion system tip protein VgrG [Flavobacterium arcticum]